jgi:hypothetical protein
MDIKIFRENFVEKVLETINNKGYDYKSRREVFVKSDGEHQFYVFIYMYKRNTFIELETKAYYGNKLIENELKAIDIKMQNKEICGGNIDFISEYYFGRKFPEKYSNLIYMFDENISLTIEKWLYYFDDIIEPFFKDCKNPIILNNIVNNAPIEKPDLNSSYETRVMKFYFIGKRAGLTNDELLNLSNLYEAELKSWGNDSKYLSQFLEIKNKLISTTY